MNNMGTNRPKPKSLTFYQALEEWHGVVDASLVALEKPEVMRVPSKTTEIKAHLKNTLKEAITAIQKQILIGEENGTSVCRADPTGWTKGHSAYSSAAVIAKYKFAPLVDELCKEILKEQETNAAEQGILVSEQQLTNAKEDINDANKKTVTLETTTNENGEASKLVIDKETGDAELHEKDPKTGLWRRVGNKIKGFWTCITDGFKDIIGWCSKQWSRFSSWFKNLFRTPADSEVQKAS